MNQIGHLGLYVCMSQQINFISVDQIDEVLWNAFLKHTGKKSNI